MGRSRGGGGSRVPDQTTPTPLPGKSQVAILGFLKNSGADTLTKNSFRNTIRVANSLHPDQTLHSVGPDLGPNFFQGFQLIKKNIFDKCDRHFLG